MTSAEGFDVVIVGGGAAGCVLARRLSQAGDRRVLLLEAGPDLRAETSPPMRDGWRLPTVPDWGFQSEPDAGRAAATLRRGRLLGGTSWLTRFGVRGWRGDFDGWAGAGNPGWGFDDVLPAFRRLEADLDFGDDLWHGDAGPMPITRYLDHTRSAIHEASLAAFDALGFPRVDDHNAPDAVGYGPMPMSSRAGARVTAVDAYLPSAATAPALTVRPDSPVSRVLLDAGRATGVGLIDGTDIDAGVVILAAGVYGSPAVLMRSGIGPEGHLREIGIPVRVNLPGVGANLADHPGVDLDSGWRGAGVGEDEPILHSIATFRSSGRASGTGPDLMFWVTDPFGAEPGFSLDPVLLKPIARGSVRLRSADPLDPLRIRLPVVGEAAGGETDLDRLVEGYRLGLELANRPEVRRLSPEPAPPGPSDLDAMRRIVRENAYSIPHVVGTCAMGSRAVDGAVVDAQACVHGVEGLMVVDASIIPEPPSGFPHVITLMIAEHVAHRLVAQA
jgi:choline dehydrogenase